MNYKLRLLYLIIIALCCDNCYCQSKQSITVKKIVFIRHGEKPDKSDNLSCKGLNRALELPGVLRKKIGLIDYLLVPSLNNGKSTNHARMFQTIIPYAIQQNMDINTKYDETDNKLIAEKIKYLNGTVLLVWEHKNILKIVRELGVKDNLTWDDNDFDSIWIITFDKGSPSLKRETENLNPSDKCN